ncbi:keratin, type I cytoskeletal 19-like [Pelodytes ibericus]
MSYRFKQKNFGGHFTQISSHSHHSDLYHSHHFNHGGFHKSLLGISHCSHHGGFHKPMNEFSNHSYHGGLHKALSGYRIPHHGKFHLEHYGSIEHLNHKEFNYPDVSHHYGVGNKVVFSDKHLIQGHRNSNVPDGYGHGTVIKYVRGSSWKRDDFCNIKEKETMQLLNERLSSYLEKVSSLEQSNAQLERKICEWYEKNSPTKVPDYSQSLRMIEEIQGQISTATRENARISLQTDNDKIVLNDIKTKYEELLELSSMANAKALHKVMEGLNQETGELETKVQNLQQVILRMRRNNEMTVKTLTADLGAKVSVEVEAAPSANLNIALSDIRDQYENLIERNSREAESMFLHRTLALSEKVTSGAEQMQSNQTKLIDLKHIVQALEIELQSEQDMTSALEDTLEETQDSYASRLTHSQCTINNSQGILVKVRKEIKNQNREYCLLMNQKIHLEKEIATYQQLLDANDIQLMETPVASAKNKEHDFLEQDVTENSPQVSIT